MPFEFSLDRAFQLQVTREQAQAVTLPSLCRSGVPRAVYSDFAGKHNSSFAMSTMAHPFSGDASPLFSCTKSNVFPMPRHI